MIIQTDKERRTVTINGVTGTFEEFNNFYSSFKKKILVRLKKSEKGSAERKNVLGTLRKLEFANKQVQKVWHT